MAVKLIDDKDIWDKFIDESPYGTIFHKWEFLSIVEKYSGYKLRRYGIYRGEELVCLYPIFIREFLGLRMVFSPPPNMAIPHMGFVMSATYDRLKQRRKESYVNDVMDEMEQELKGIRANFISISTVSGFLDMRPLKWNNYNVQMYYTYIIDLMQPLEKIWDNFDNDLRREIRKTSDLGLSIRETSDIDEFYRIMKDRYRQQGLNLPIVSKEYLKDIIAAFPDNVKANFLYKDDKVVDLVAYYQYKKRFVFWIGWVNLDKNMHSNEYMSWEYAKMKKAEGLEKLEIQGANVKRLCFFKSKFNGALEYDFTITKKDILGSIAEGTYRRFIKRRWI
jgi:hypothetical protein